MISKLKKFESTFHIGQATLIIATFTLLSRVIGSLRVVLLASHLGASAESDIYLTAFRIPDLVYNLLILGTLSVAFIPVFSEYYIKDKPRAMRIASSVMNISALGMVLVCLLILIFANPLTKLVAPGFTPDQMVRTANLTRIMLLSPLIFTISNVLSSVLISMKKFLIVNVAPLLYNVGIIFGIIFLYPHFGLAGLAYGVILGALMHAGIQLPEALRHGFKWKATLDYNDPGVRKIGALFLPRIVGLDTSYVNLILVTIIGSTLVSGSITAFNYANDLQAVALGVFALSSAVAIFPVLSEHFAKGDTAGFIRSLQRTIIRVLYFIVPMTILLLLLRAHIVRLLLGYGACDWNCTIVTFNTLGVLALGLVAQSLVPLFARSFYSRQNTKTPVAISLISMAINGVLSYTFAQHYGVVGIAIGFVIATTFQCILLFVLLHRSFVQEDHVNKTALRVFDSIVVAQSLKILLASVLLGGITYLTLYLVDPILNTRTVLGIFTQAGLATTIGAIVYVAVTQYLGIRESQAVGRAIAKVFKLVRGRL